MITNIYNKINMLQVKSDNFKVFNAGKLAEQKKLDDYLDKFQDLRQNGYIFIPTIVESHGGLSKGIRKICNTFLRRIAKDKNKEFSVLVHNYYIRFSIFYQKLKYQSLWNHYRIL